jgi:hypothetical protein
MVRRRSTVRFRNGAPGHEQFSNDSNERRGTSPGDALQLPLHSDSSHCTARARRQLLKVAVGDPSRDSLVTVRARSRWAGEPALSGGLLAAGLVAFAAFAGVEAWLHPAEAPWSAAVYRCRFRYQGGLGGGSVGGWPPVPAAEQGSCRGDEQGADEEGVHEDADRERCEDAGVHPAAGQLPDHQGEDSEGAACPSTSCSAMPGTPPRR